MKITRFLVLAPVLGLLVGCKGDEMSDADQQKMKQAMAPGKTDFGTMTPEQKAGFERWKASGAPTGGPVGTAGASGSGG